MGDFRGHFIPGCMFLFGALYLVLKGGNYRFAASLRNSYSGLASAGFIGLIGSGIMGIGEFLVAGSPFLPSHQAHYRFNFAVFFFSFLYLMHLSQTIKGKFWGLLPAFCFVANGFTILLHHQDALSRAMAHTVAGCLFLFFALSYAIEYLFLCYYYPQRPKIENTSRKCNPIYLNSNVYDTPFPLLTAYAMCLNGCWWLLMAFDLFLESPMDGMNGGGGHGSHGGGHGGSMEMMASMLISDMIYNLFMYSIAGFVCVHLICAWIDTTVWGEKDREEV